jgi:hypothetical protein
MLYVGNHANPSGPSYQHDTNVNPLKSALLPVCRAMALVDFRSFNNGECNSINNVIYNGYGVEDPESEVYEYLYNSNHLPSRVTLNGYYLGEFESSRLYMLYYYQGDAIP